MQGHQTFLTAAIETITRLEASLINALMEEHRQNRKLQRTPKMEAQKLSADKEGTIQDKAWKDSLTEALN